MIDIVVKIPEKPGGPLSKSFYFSAGARDIAEAAEKIINDSRAVEEDTVIDALLDLATKKIQQYGLPDPDRVMRFVLGFDEFYGALESEFATRKEKMKDKIFEIGFTYKGGLLDETPIEDGLETIDFRVGEAHVEAFKSRGPSAIKQWLRGECKFYLHKKHKTLDWCQISFEDSADEFIYEIARRAFEEKGDPVDIKMDSLKSLKTDDFDHLFKPVNFRIEKPAFFGASLNYRAGTVEGRIERVFLLPPGLSEEGMKRFCCSEIKREVRAMHNTCDFMVTHFVGGLIE